MSAEPAQSDAPFSSEELRPKIFLIKFWTFIIGEEQKNFVIDKQSYKHIHKSLKAFPRNVVIV